MGTAKSTLRKLKRVERSLDNTIENIVKSLKTEIIDLVRRDQLLEKGIGPDGTIIGIYSKATGKMSAGFSGPGFPKTPGSPYNFLDDGEMYSSYTIEVGLDKLTIVNTSLSLNLFLGRTGLDTGDVIGLTAENSRKLNFEMLLPKLRNEIRTQMQ